MHTNTYTYRTCRIELGLSEDRYHAQLEQSVLFQRECIVRDDRIEKLEELKQLKTQSPEKKRKVGRDRESSTDAEGSNPKDSSKETPTKDSQGAKPKIGKNYRSQVPTNPSAQGTR